MGIATVLGNEAVTREECFLEEKEPGLEEMRAIEAAPAEQAIFELRLQRMTGMKKQSFHFRV